MSRIAAVCPPRSTGRLHGVPQHRIESLDMFAVYSYYCPSLIIITLGVPTGEPWFPLQITLTGGCNVPISMPSNAKGGNESEE